jgi:hypothetical protein
LNSKSVTGGIASWKEFEHMNEHELNRAFALEGMLEQAITEKETWINVADLLYHALQSGQDKEQIFNAVALYQFHKAGH